jgi:hypothetical protein
LRISGVIAPTQIIGVPVSRESGNCGTITPVMVEMIAGTFSTSTRRTEFRDTVARRVLAVAVDQLDRTSPMPPAALISSSASSAPRLKSAP